MLLVMEKKYDTREQWMRAAVDKINEEIFGGDMDIVKYQISSSLLNGKALGNTVMPFDGEDVGLNDFFLPQFILMRKLNLLRLSLQLSRMK